MWPFSQRGAEWQDCLEDLEQRLESKGVILEDRIFSPVEREGIINRLTYGNFLTGILSRLLWYRGNICFNRGILDLVEQFRRNRKDLDYDLEIVVDTSDEEGDFVYVGYIRNPDFEEQAAQYNKERTRYMRQRLAVMREKEKLEKSSEFEVYQHVMKERTKAVLCCRCSEPLFLRKTCPECGGEIYEPQINEEQERVAKTVEEKLSTLTIPPFSPSCPYPLGELSVSVRIK